MLNEPVKPLCDAGRGIGDGNHRAITGDVGQGLPAWAGEGVGVAHSVSFAELALNRDHKVAAHGGWRKKDGRGLNPKAALNGKACAAWDGGDGLGNGAAQSKPRAATERRAAARDYATGEGETCAALGKGGAGNEQE